MAFDLNIQVGRFTDEVQQKLDFALSALEGTNFFNPESVRHPQSRYFLCETYMPISDRFPLFFHTRWPNDFIRCFSLLNGRDFSLTSPTRNPTRSSWSIASHINSFYPHTLNTSIKLRNFFPTGRFRPFTIDLPLCAYCFYFFFPKLTEIRN